MAGPLELHFQGQGAIMSPAYITENEALESPFSKTVNLFEIG